MEAAEALALIEKIIEEHRVYIFGGFQDIERVANDVIALRGLQTGKEAFMPGRFDERQGLKKLKEALEAVARGLRAHFNREETGLPGVVTQYGNEETASALRSLLEAHDDLRNRLAYGKKHVVELTSGKLSRLVWEATAHDTRAHITHTRKLLEAHAQAEQKLLHKLQKRLKEGIPT